MVHFPVNHRLRGTYRGLTVLAALYLIAFGVVGLVTSGGGDFFGRGDHWSLGLHTNPAQSWAALLLGVVLAAVALIGGNVHHFGALYLGWGLLGLAIAGLCVLQTTVNVFNLSVVNIVVYIVIGLVVLLAGLYGKVDDDPESTEREHAATLSRG